jgi:peptidoglycan hydrolase-like protein with peptidoglycan-binding domain
MKLRQFIGLGVALVASAALATGTATAMPKAPDDVSVMIRDCVDVPNQDVGIGSTGSYVREVQCLLNWAINPATFPLIAVDGQFGPITRNKVIKFQQCANALGAGLVVDGRVGPRTAPHLEWWAAHSAYIC